MLETTIQPPLDWDGDGATLVCPNCDETVNLGDIDTYGAGGSAIEADCQCGAEFTVEAWWELESGKVTIRLP